MKSNQVSCMGAIFFFIGLILILLSWHLSYPIYITELNELTFAQFYPSIWPGIVLSLVGLFIAGYFSKRKSVKVACASFFLIILSIHAFYFSYITSSDCGNVKAWFEIFHQVGINAEVISYFQYPTYFSLNEITSQILGLGANDIAVIFFFLYGILLGLYLFLFLLKITKNSRYHIAFLAIPLYFTGLFGFLNYQWVPQTLALVFVFLLLFLFDQGGIQYKLLSIVVFTALVFTHAFIPVIFLLFFGLYVLKKKEFRRIFLLMACIYASVLVYYTTFYFPLIIETFKTEIFDFGESYSATVSRSFRESTNLMSQILSLINRVRVPLTWLVVSVGFLLGFIKKRISYTLIVLGITGGVYLITGTLFLILGMRALQILFVSLVTGIGFFITKWKKPMLTFVVILLILSVFGSMRATYDRTSFLSNEEENACDFLANKLTSEKLIGVALGQVNYGYFTSTYIYLNGVRPNSLRPAEKEFYGIFKASMKKNECVIYNPNLGKDIISYGMKIEEVYDVIERSFSNNKIYECGKTSIVIGR